MDPTITQEVVATQQATSIAAVLTIVLIVGAVLIGIIVMQNRRIKEMQKPKYGFLGKPLNAFILLAIMLGGIGFVYYATNNTSTEFVDVSADSELDATIVVTQVDSVNRVYQFNVIPSIDGNEWGGNSIYEFDVQWTISNGEVYQTIESGVSSQNTGGVRLTLKPGTYDVTANVFIDDKSTEATLNPPLVVE